MDVLLQAADNKPLWFLGSILRFERTEILEVTSFSAAAIKAFTPESAIEDALATYYGLGPYEWLRDFVLQHPSEIKSSKDFRRIFNALFSVRRSKSWMQVFYSLFQKAALDEETDFLLLLTELSNKTGCIETSFVSKMIALIEPDKPIWDRRVVGLLNSNSSIKLPIPSALSTKEKRLQAAQESYEGLCAIYKSLLVSTCGKQLIAGFDEVLPNHTGISKTKKIDCLLWGMGTNKNSFDKSRGD